MLDHAAYISHYCRNIARQLKKGKAVDVVVLLLAEDMILVQITV
jgi:hypothetical protein